MIFCFDTETYPIQRGRTIPKAVCASYSHHDPVRDLTSPPEVRCSSAELWAEIESEIRTKTVVGHNIAYDLAVLCNERPEAIRPVFAALAEGRVVDTLIRARLHDLGSGGLRGGYSLAALVEREFGRTLSGKSGTDAWRLRYNELDGVPIEDWPTEAVEYAANDAIWTLRLALRLGPVADEARQVRFAFALHLASAWGVRVNETTVRELKARLRAEIKEIETGLQGCGFIRKNGTLDTKRVQVSVKAAYAAQGLPLPVSEKTGAPSRDKRTLQRSGDPDLIALARRGGPASHLRNFVRAAEEKARGGRPLNTRFHVLRSTGRISSSGPNLQNVPREGGYRECIEARPGRLLLSIDYSQAEMACFAQACLDLVGWSTLADVFRAAPEDESIPTRWRGLLPTTVDTHAIVGAPLAGVPVADLDRSLSCHHCDGAGCTHCGGSGYYHAWCRQLGKIGNFGFLGGMGIPTFTQHLIEQGIDHATEDLSREIKYAFDAAWPEAREYLQFIGRQVAGGGATIVQLRSGRVRADCGFTQSANTYFQGLAADLMSDAFSRISEACYAGRTSALYGARPLLQIHDEIVIEVDDDPDAADRAAFVATQIMVDAAAHWVPAVPVRADPALARIWSKGSKARFNGDQLIHD